MSTPPRCTLYLVLITNQITETVTADWSTAVTWKTKTGKVAKYSRPIRTFTFSSEKYAPLEKPISPTPEHGAELDIVIDIKSWKISRKS